MRLRSIASPALLFLMVCRDDLCRLANDESDRRRPCEPAHSRRSMAQGGRREIREGQKEDVLRPPRFLVIHDFFVDNVQKIRYIMCTF
jgi:hypothetical protein